MNREEVKQEIRKEWKRLYPADGSGKGITARTAARRWTVKGKKMIKLTQDELNKKIELHRFWLEGKDGGERFVGAYNLSEADLSGVNLSEADLSEADLSEADLSGANLSEADLSRETAIPEIPLSCPTHGEFTAWKKANGKIVKLKIPEDARRSSATTSKCRCDKAFVLAIENLDGTDSGLSEIINNNYAKCIYKVGEMVYPDSFDENRFNECSHGIHFFIDRGEAERW